MKVLKTRTSVELGEPDRKETFADEMLLSEESSVERCPQFWQRRFYDFNVWSVHKQNEKMNYMHFNPVKRGLAPNPNEWRWSSIHFYSNNDTLGLCAPNPEWIARKNTALVRSRKTPSIRGFSHALVAKTATNAAPCNVQGRLR